MGQTQIMQQDKPGITGIRRAEEQLPLARPSVCGTNYCMRTCHTIPTRHLSRADRATTAPSPQPRSSPLSLSLSVLRVRRFLIPKQLILLNQQSVPPPVKLFSRTRLRFVRRAPLAWSFDNFGSLTRYKSITRREEPKEELNMHSILPFKAS